MATATSDPAAEPMPLAVKYSRAKDDWRCHRISIQVRGHTACGLALDDAPLKEAQWYLCLRCFPL